MPDSRIAILGIVPARGGSKSLPRKNIRSIAGRPLIAWTILASSASARLTRLIVTTDDEEIAAVARREGAEVPFLRPAALAGDHVTDLPVFQHCLEWLAANEGYSPDLVVHLRPTSPLRTAGHIDAAIELLCDSPDADSVRSVCPAPQHPMKTWRRDAGWLAPFVPEEVFGIREAFNQPRQLLPEAFVQNGAVDVIRADTIMRLHSMSGSRIRPFVMDEEVSINIDSSMDWDFAEHALRARVRAGLVEG